MKQKIVIKVQMNCQKCRTKALKTASKAYGVESVALDGEEKVVVVGNQVDAVKLTKSLRKLGRSANIESVEEVKPEKKEEKSKDDEKKSIPPPYYYTYPMPFTMVIEEPSSCLIM